MSFATLDPSFFQHKRPLKCFYLKHAALYPWSADCLPVYEWQGLLFVACVNPEAISAESNWVIVQAQSEDLRNLWNQWSEPASNDPSELFFNIDGESDLKNQFEGPVGLVDFENLSADVKTETLKSVQDATENLEKSLKLEIQPIEKPAHWLQNSLLQPLMAGEKKAKAEKTKNSLEKSFEEIDEIFKSLSFSYSKIMVLIKEKDTVSPWRWSQSFNHTSLNDSVYDLALPSPFRIVNRTALPFHGKPQKSDVLDQFAQNWNSGKYPGNLTVSPIIMNDQVIAMLLCVGEEATFTKNHLSGVNQKSQEIASIFGKIPPKAA
jgi:hypothetical protein